MNTGKENILNPGSILIDERNTADLILLVKKMAQTLNYYNQKNEIDGDFSVLLDSDESFLIAEISKFPIASFAEKRLQLIARFDQAEGIRQGKKILISYIELTDILFLQIHEWYRAAQKNNLSQQSSPIEKELEFAIQDKLAQLFSDYQQVLATTVALGFTNPTKINDTFKDIDSLWGTPNSSLLTDLQKGSKENALNNSIKKIILISTEVYEVIYDLTLKATDLLDKSLYENDNHKAHIGLIFAFLKLFKHLQKDLNTFTKKQLDFYFKKLLEQKLQPSSPLETYVRFGLDANSDEVLLGNEYSIIAGQYSNGDSIKFRMNDEVRVNNIKVSSLATIYASRNPLFDFRSKYKLVSSVYHQVIANLPSEVNKFTQNDETFSALGSEQDLLTSAEMTMEKASLGFLVASSVLKLSPSDRFIRMEMNFSPESIHHLSNLILDISANTDLNEEEIFNQVFSDAFEIEFTVAEGWYQVKDYAVIPPLDWSTGKIILQFRLNAQAPGFINFDSGIHQLKLETQHPVLKINLKQDSFYNAYSFINALELTKIKLDVEVDKLRNFKIFRGAQQIDNNSEFDLFGPVPKYGAKLYVCCEELFNKKISALGMHWEYTNIPVASKNLEEYYSSYNENIDDQSFKIKLSALSDFNFQKHDAPEFTIPLFETDSKQEIKGERSFQFEDLTALKIFPNYGLNPGDIQQFSNTLETGVIQLELTAPHVGFGFDIYPKLQAQNLTQQLQTNSKKEEIPPPEIQEPYAPKIDQFQLNYKASSTLYFSETNRRSNDLEAKNALFQFSPYGVEQIFSNLEISKKTLLYEFPNEGELIIGLQCDQPFTGINLLFEIVKNQHIAYEFSREIEWYYTSNQGWKKMNVEHILVDQTQNLMKTGVISFRFPSDFSLSSRILSPDQYYIKACSREKADQFGLIRSIYTNAVKVLEEIPPPNTPRVKQLPAGSVEGFEKKVSGIIQVEQPFESKIKRAHENEIQFYTRISHLLRHKKRPINHWDYENFILDAFEWLSHVKCFPIATDNQKINLKIMCIKHIEEYQNIDEVKLSSAEMNQIKEHLVRYISPFVVIEFINPLFEDLWIKCKLQFQNIPAGKAVERFNQEFFQFICQWRFYNENTSVPLPTRIKKIDIIKFIQSREYIRFVTGISIVHLIQAADGSINVYDSAVSSEDDEYISCGSEHSILVPRNQHRLEILSKEEHHLPEPTNFDELAISDSFFIVSKPEEKTIKNVYHEENSTTGEDDLEFVLSI